MAVRTARPGLPARPRLLAPALAVAALVLVLGGVFVSLYTDLLWFREVGFGTVFTTVLRTRLLLFLGFGLLMAVIVGANLAVAYRVRPPFRPMSLEQQNLERYRMGVEPFLVPLTLLVSGLLGLFAGLSAASRWQTWMLWRNRTDFGTTDEQFGRDVAYYAMTYPFQRFVLGFLLTAVVLSLIAAAATHYLFGGLRLQTAGDKVSPAARAHLSVLVGVLVLLKAVAYYLDRFGLAFSERGRVQGASFTDVNAVLPAKNILIFVAIICALLFFANIVVRNILLPGGALALLVLSAIVLGGLFPAYTQQFRVKPNELEREDEYIGRNIAATRLAYGIDTAEVQDYTPRDTPEPGTLQRDEGTLPNARLLDPNVLAPTYEQTQRLRAYFGINTRLDIDRYTDASGNVRDYVLAAREVELENLPVGQRNWVNEHLAYTHGNGLVAAPANAVDATGVPLFEPPEGVLKVTQPRIYFGELSPDYSVVRTRTGEIDGPAGPDEAASAEFTYDGDGGVQLSGPLRKVAYAMKFREKNLLLSGSIHDESRLMYIRQPRERVQKVAPFLQLDNDPYPVAVGGKVLWVVDGYTTSSAFPYSQSEDFGDVITDSQTGVRQSRQVNYIRNSVKATVDAYTGDVVLYKFGPTDPVLETWSKAFPGVLQDETAISDELRAHLRYPEDLFKVQRELLARYHVQDPAVFFQGEDFWSVPADPAAAVNRVANEQAAGTATTAVAPAAVDVSADGPDQPPYYALLQFPGQPAARFSLSTSLVAANRPNLAAFLSVSSDPDDYGKLRVLRMPRSDQPEGPGLIANQILANKDVADALFSLGRNGRKLTFGNLLFLPVGGGLLAVQPLYVSQQGAGGFPTLQRIIVSYGAQTASGATFGQALTALLSQTNPGQLPTTPTPTGSASPSPSPSGTPRPPADLAAAVEAADTAFRAGQEALAGGDFAEYGRQQDRLEQALERLTELQGAGATRTPTPAG